MLDIGEAAIVEMAFISVSIDSLSLFSLLYNELSISIL